MSIAIHRSRSATGKQPGNATDHRAAGNTRFAYASHKIEIHGVDHTRYFRPLTLECQRIEVCPPICNPNALNMRTRTHILQDPFPCDRDRLRQARNSRECVETRVETQNSFDPILFHDG